MRRNPQNPILTRADIPDLTPHVTDVSSVFNPGAFEIDGRTRLVLRVQTRGRESVIMLADSNDGVAFVVQPRVLEIAGLEKPDPPLFHVYDLRVSRIDDELLVVFAADTDDGCRLGLARMPRGERLELIGLGGDIDARNGVLFPEKIGGRYLRLERPNRTLLASAVGSGDEIWLAESDDLVLWRPVAPVLAGRPHYWDELIGSGPPPVKTREGWLHVYHGVARHFAAANIYQAGVCLLDLEDPTRVVARGRNNILEPREPYELVGQVPNVVFPTGIIVEGQDADGFAGDDSIVRLYYGAADSCIGLAETTIGELLHECRIQ